MHIGIVGAGQLGQMMAQAGAPLNIDFTFLDPATAPCAAPYGALLTADWNDADALKALTASADVVTFEFENVSPRALEQLSSHRPAFPPATALETSRDRLHEKSLFASLDIPLPPIARVDNQRDLEQAVAKVGLPAVLKTRTLGYDGKGQKVLRSEQDIAGTFEELGSVPLILEGFVDFDHEVSVIAVRGRDGETRFWDLSENEHRAGILHCAIPRQQHPFRQDAFRYAGQVMDALDYVGVMAFEFFVTSEGLIANEIAPRVHNSGHWSIEGAQTSQFENHVRAVAGLPLGTTDLITPCAMLNIIGAMPSADALLAIPGVRLHDYNKAPRPGRKIGHVTVLAQNNDELKTRIDLVENALTNDLGVS
ncbi:5-(carboxyamino)imidazole ribonucleotide synthase [Carnimonas bestiolae]|uniref:5-(carboxyamino)imidazole ribonucleotide synthase n=1 Tax=Carnimonas bestiolae TaxID=3402172 RepID=UPI003EDC77B7